MDHHCTCSLDHLISQQTMPTTQVAYGPHRVWSMWAEVYNKAQKLTYFHLTKFFSLFSAATETPAPCSSGDLNKWDKLFSMLENSQMRENMLLQYTSDIVKVEMGSLRDEMLKLVEKNLSIYAMIFIY